MSNSRGATALICAALLAGCGGSSSEEPDVTQNVTSADLERMVLPKHALGPLARGVRRNSESGVIDNKAAADDTIDFMDTARSLTRAGRISGYELFYSARRPSRKRAWVIGTEVELFRTEKAASRYNEKQLADFARMRGRTVEATKLSEADRFDVGGVGNEAGGLRLILSRGEDAVFGTVVAFRRGRIAGSVAVFLTRELVITSDVERIADTLDDRIKRVAAARG